MWLRKYEHGASVLKGGWGFHEQVRGACKERRFQVESMWCVGDSKWPGVAGPWNGCVLGRKTIVGSTA